ncbi:MULTISPECIES: hypothetical protein [unclassified Sphingomonas]|uniref:hypothetical protein n=1 Tax=unclassified Sphingomonas TaxID=196159 RepID=UPI0006FF5EA5|nr:MULTISPECIES: hypothetical protein [unclassified Sphingomonas]KQX21739.1 hypothetical protein ASD17_06925 [Sphingomonas sp. Root1294]KQY73054.1 hypothetical protein ASD39_00910 [Sphingomonas sp. Root50]KRB88215.1 hypothetical protein ASE22_22525 [Sphingomonas sp. Root720]
MKMLRPARLVPLAPLALLAACGPGGHIPVVSAPPPPTRAEAGLDRVLGRDARALISLFGTPDQDIREDPARKLQYASGVCVLDAYLYPPAPGREPVVTHVDARLPTGEDIDRASCIAALSRRKEAR